MRLPIAALSTLALALAACPPAESAVDLAPDASAPDSPQPSATAPTLTADGGASEPPPKAAAVGMTLFVAEALVDCQGVGPMKCMRVRATPEEPWRLHYSGIDGFDYQPGVVYELRVEKVDNPRPAADAPSFRYRLLEVVAKRKPDAAP